MPSPLKLPSVRRSASLSCLYTPPLPDPPPSLGSDWADENNQFTDLRPATAYTRIRILLLPLPPTRHDPAPPRTTCQVDKAIHLVRAPFGRWGRGARSNLYYSSSGNRDPSTTVDTFIRESKPETSAEPSRDGPADYRRIWSDGSLDGAQAWTHIDRESSYHVRRLRADQKHRPQWTARGRQVERHGELLHRSWLKGNRDYRHLSLYFRE